jgi:hypothetical protein
VVRIDRARQKEILSELAEIYPAWTTDCVRETRRSEDIAILWYLREHELVAAALERTLSGSIVFEGASITAKGLDFLADDGGLSSILGTLTVKLHEDTIRELLLHRVNDLEIPSEEKSILKQSLSEMSSEALKVLTRSLVEKGIQYAPNLYQLATDAIKNAT